MAIRSTPPARFTTSSHGPDRGSAAIPPLTNPTTTSRPVNPSENTNKYRKPSQELPVVLTKVNTAAKAGAPHGAATRPEVAPRKNTPVTVPASMREIHAFSRAGTLMVKTSNRASPNTSSRLPIANRAQGLELTAPKRLPDSPASSPSSEYTSARPTTYASVRLTVRPRERGAAAPAPLKIPAVM